MSAALTRLGYLLRGFLARKGFVISHIEAGVPERLESYLGALANRGISFERIGVFDSDPEILNVFLDIFAAQKIQFQSDPNLASPPSSHQNGERLLLEVDLGALCFKPVSPWMSCLDQAAVVVIRSKLSRFWTGQADLHDLVRAMAELGFHFHDVLQRPAGPPINAPNENIFFAFERQKPHSVRPRDPYRNPEFRVAEALTLLGAPIVPESALHRLAGRGSHGFAAGLFNPGALDHDGRLLLLARGERAPWPVQKRSYTRYLSSCQPVLLTLGPDLQISTATEVRVADAPGSDGSRFEDFRLFAHQGRVYSNHSMIRCESGGDRSEGAPIRPERLQTSVGISHFDVGSALLKPLGRLVLDRPVARVEKNWAMFSTGDRVHLIYSFQPYRLFSTAAFPDLRFALTAERALKLPLPEDGLSLRNSINPIPWDSNHLLHIVHKVFPDKRYVFWAVLLDQRTLLPAKISRRPLLSARSSGASITYACSAIGRDDELLLFGGIDDCSIGAWRIRKVDLDSQWSAIG